MPQAGYWPENLLDATLEANGVEITFPVSDRTVDGGRDWAPRRYVFRNGQSDEDVGARPRTLSYSVPLYRDIETGDYPNKMRDLIEFIESDDHKGRATLTDVEFGPLPVRMTSFQWSTSSKQRDGGELQLSFETLGDENSTLITSDDINSAESDPVEEATQADQALADAEKKPTDSAQKMKDAGVPITETERLELGLSASFSANVGLAPGVTFEVPQAPALPTFTTTVQSSTGFAPTTIADTEVQLLTSLSARFVEQVNGGEFVTANEMAAALETFLARVAAVRDDPDFTTKPELGYPVFVSTARLMSAAQRIAGLAFSELPLVLDYELTKEMSAIEVAVALFNDPSRAQDIVDLNPSLSPDFFKRGTVLVVPLE